LNNSEATAESLAQTFEDMSKKVNSIHNIDLFKLVENSSFARLFSLSDIEGIFKEEVNDKLIFWKP